jgi:hypothetical protein
VLPVVLSVVLLVVLVLSVVLSVVVVVVPVIVLLLLLLVVVAVPVVVVALRRVMGWGAPYRAGLITCTSERIIPIQDTRYPTINPATGNPATAQQQVRTAPGKHRQPQIR